MRTSKYEVYQDDSGQWRFRLKGANGEILNDNYTRRQDALRGVEAHRRAAARARVVVLDETSLGAV